MRCVFLTRNGLVIHSFLFHVEYSVRVLFQWKCIIQEFADIQTHPNVNVLQLLPLTMLEIGFYVGQWKLYSHKFVWKAVKYILECGLSGKCSVQFLVQLFQTICEIGWLRSTNALEDWLGGCIGQISWFFMFDAGTRTWWLSGWI